MNNKSLSIAILYTGQVRTLLQTIEAFKTNVIETNKHHMIHIYTCLEYPEISNQIEINHYKQEVEQLFHDQFQKHLKTMIWISSKDPLCQFIREKTVENMPISDLWKDYLCNRSGSITEYYQLYKGCEQIENYENQTQMKYDLFIRTRCDIMIPSPLNFDVFQYSKNEIITRLQIIRENFPTVSNAQLICLYITSIPQPIEHAMNRISTPKFTLESLYNNTVERFPIYQRFFNPNHPENPLLTIDEMVEFIQMVLPYTKITFRQNLFYFAKFSIEKYIIFNYKYIQEKRTKHTYCYNEKDRKIEFEDIYWFNAENIYQKHVIEKDNLIINSYTEKEENSLYNPDLIHDNTPLFYLLRK